MVFSSPVFLFVFLPLTIVAWIAFGRSKVVLLLASLLFYAWGEPYFVALLLAVIGFNYVMGAQVAQARGRQRKYAFVAGVAINVFVLAIFKYSAFAASNLNSIFSTAFFPQPQLRNYCNYSPPASV